MANGTWMGRGVMFGVALLVAALPLDAQEGLRTAKGVRGRMAVTVDDLPVGAGPRTLDDQRAVTEALLRTLKRHEVPAVGFVNESKLETDGAVDPRRTALLARWLDAGFELGNHGYAHLDLHDVATDRWLADVLRGERVTRPLVEAHGSTLRWFRHPFLHAGMSVAVQERTAAFLSRHGYRVAPVTIDNGEYVYGGAYAGARARGDSATMERVGRDYVRYMLAMVEYWDGQARVIVGEDFPHVLLIHAYALNADWLGTLLGALEAEGWRWITLDDAVSHPAYGRSIAGWTGRGGISWIHRWALGTDMDRSVFRGEPEVPEWVVDLYERRHEATDRGSDYGARAAKR